MAEEGPRLPPLPRWDFTAIADGWIWQKFDAEGRASPIYGAHSFGQALNDAMDDGFVPSMHHWLLDEKMAVTYFDPGNEPRTLIKPEPSI